MSLVYSNPTLKSGIVQRIDKACKTNPISYPIAEKTADVNSAMDAFTAMAIQASGKQQYDDTNHEKYSIITMDLIAGRRDYSYLFDEEGVLILDIYKVLVKDPDSGTYYEVKAVDQQSDKYVYPFFNGLNQQGKPQQYDKTGNAIFFDLLSQVDVEDGIKIYINRESSYFSTTDTTKMPGVPGILHDYFWIKPSYEYAFINGLKNVNSLGLELAKMEAKITTYFGRREKDVKVKFKSKFVPFR